MKWLAQQCNPDSIVHLISSLCELGEQPQRCIPDSWSSDDSGGNHLKSIEDSYDTHQLAPLWCWRITPDCRSNMRPILYSSPSTAGIFVGVLLFTGGFPEPDNQYVERGPDRAPCGLPRTTDGMIIGWLVGHVTFKFYYAAMGWLEVDGFIG